ncbi:MAG TPA: hypothetical protein VHC04_00105 [Rhodopila sp.]|nr:hypothetical protein [Rhodopila sp.]HVZ06299.1 hypothetical protein [Rhodopila sp.]
MGLLKRDLNTVVGIFADDAVVEYGAGESGHLISYPCRVQGREKIKEFYEKRFARGQTFDDARPFCAVRKRICELSNWVIVNGYIADQDDGGKLEFSGEFLQVWRFDPRSGKVTSCDVHFDPVASGSGSPRLFALDDFATN